MPKASARRRPARGTKSRVPPSPERIVQATWGFGVTQALATALDLDLFTHVANGRRRPEEIAAAARATERGVRMVADAMVALGFLSRRGEYGPLSLAPDAAAFLVRDRASYVGDLVSIHAREIADRWRHLTESVRTGKPPIAVDHPSEGVPFWHVLVDALFPLGYRPATEIGKELARRHPTGSIRLLDVAAGSGVWGIGAASVVPRVRVTAADLPESLEHARTWVSRFRLDERFEFLPGDLRAADYGVDRFDAAVLGHICHSEGPVHTPALLAKVARALRPGGTLAIVEFVPDDDRRGPPHALLFALNMLVHTTDGDTFTAKRYASWLADAGFEDVRSLAVSAPSPVILATRA